MSANIQTHRLSSEQYAQNFCDAHPPLNLKQALIEADRCYFCYDAPCTTACPTSIDIPSFIHRISDGNLHGAAKQILTANPLGGMCARVCPTEELCEQACVRNTNEGKPVEIGLLQRFATDAHFAQPELTMFTRAAETGKRVAVVGAGPAGLACAHQLAVQGHQVALFDAKDKLGGLNEYGLATYKTVGAFAQKEIDWLLSVGGIDVHLDHALGREIQVSQLVQDYDAVFVGVGLAGVNELGFAVPQHLSIRPAVDFISQLRQAKSPSDVPIGANVVVIGGGMTAVDASVQARLLGAQNVTMVYRRGVEAMGASVDEQEWACHNGVKIIHWVSPKSVTLHADHSLASVQCVKTEVHDGQLVETGETFDIAADMLLTAIGQSFVATVLEDSGIELQSGRIPTDANLRTNLTKVWAGGDCRLGGRDLTVEAVQDGKMAAASIHQFLSNA
ncbi:MAG: NAD(P)-dependent oxidoreductase [Formosimonas sp.]